VITGIKTNRKNRIIQSRKSENSILDGIEYFKKNKALHFQDINEIFLRNYKTFCTVYLGHKPRTITNQLIFIRTLFNLAIKEGVIDVKFYPFTNENEKIRIGSGHKIGLTIEEIIRIEALELEKGTSIWHTHNV